MTVYSNSSLNNFATCFEQGKQLLGPRVEKAGPSRQGQWWHAVCRQYDEHLFKTKRYSDQEHGHRIINGMKGLLSPEDEAGCLGGARYWVDNYEATWIDDAEDPAFEERFHIDVATRAIVPNERVNETSRPVFGWTCDLSWVANGRLFVRDNKSGWKIEHLKEPRENLQLRRYAACEAMRRGHTGPVVLQVSHVRHNLIEEAELEDFDPGAVFLEDIALPVTRWEEAEAGIEQRYCVGPHCSFCDVRGGCPEYKRFPGEFDDLSPAELVAAYKILGQRYGEVKERLERECVVGEVVTDEFTASFAEEQWVTFDSEKLQPLLLEYLPESMVALAFNASKTSVDKALTKAKVKPAERKRLLELWTAKAGKVDHRSKLVVRRSAR